MANVFVSYHKKDRERAEAAVASLQQHGYSVWWDDRVTPMETWDRAVEREIEQARCVLVLWTRDSVESDWVRIEANTAKVAKPAKLVQVRLEECKVPINFSMLQYTDAFGGSFDPDDNEGWGRALEWVGLFVGTKPERAAPPKPPPAKRKRAKRKTEIEEPPVTQEEQDAVLREVMPLLENVAPPTPAPPPPPPPPPLPPVPPPPPRPPIDFGAIVSRTLAGISGRFTALVSTGSYYRRGMITAAIGAFAGAVAYAAVYGIYVDTENYFARFSSTYVLRACGAAALAFVFTTTGRLRRDRAIIFGALFVALNLIYLVWRFLVWQFIDVPVGLRSFIGDLSGIALLWLIARQFGAFKAGGRRNILLIATAANVLFALMYAGMLTSENVPSEYDEGGWALFFMISLILESWMALALLEPVRVSPQAGDKTE